MPPDTETHNLTPDVPITPEQRARVEETFRREHANLRKSLRRGLPTSADADEIASEVFTNLLMRPLESVGNVKAFIRASARNLRANFFRNRQKRDEKLVLLQCESSVTAPSPESAVLQQQLLERVLAAFGAKQRLAVVLHLYEGLSPQQVAEYLAAQGFPVDVRTVQRWVKAAFESCRLELETSAEPKKESQE